MPNAPFDLNMTYKRSNGGRPNAPLELSTTYKRSNSDLGPVGRYGISSTIKLWRTIADDLALIVRARNKEGRRSLCSCGRVNLKEKCY